MNFCPRCDKQTLWANTDGGRLRYCQNIRERETKPCGFHVGVEMTGAEQFNFDAHTGNVQREHRHDQPPPRRKRYSLT